MIAKRYELIPTSGKTPVRFWGEEIAFDRWVGFREEGSYTVWQTAKGNFVLQEYWRSAWDGVPDRWDVWVFNSDDQLIEFVKKLDADRSTRESLIYQISSRKEISLEIPADQKEHAKCYNCWGMERPISKPPKARGRFKKIKIMIDPPDYWLEFRGRLLASVDDLADARSRGKEWWTRLAVYEEDSGGLIFVAQDCESEDYGSAIFVKVSDREELEEILEEGDYDYVWKPDDWPGDLLSALKAELGIFDEV